MRTTSTARTPDDYIAALEEPKRSEVRRLHALIRQTVPALDPYMQSGMIGYGKFHHKYASGREGDWCLVRLAGNKTGISVYVCAGDKNGYYPEQAGKRLGKAIVGRSCIRFKRLDDLDLDVLIEVLKKAQARPWGEQTGGARFAPSPKSGAPAGAAPARGRASSSSSRTRAEVPRGPRGARPREDGAGASGSAVKGRRVRRARRSTAAASAMRATRRKARNR